MRKVQRSDMTPLLVRRQVELPPLLHAPESCELSENIAASNRQPHAFKSLYPLERLGLPQKRRQYSTGLVNTEVLGEVPAARLDRAPRVAFPHPADKVNCPYAPVAQMDRAADFESDFGI